MSPGILFAATGDGGVVYDLVTEQLSFLNPTGAAVLAECVGGASFDAAVVEWSDAANVPEDRIRSDVERALEDFSTTGFIGRDTAAPDLAIPSAPVGPLVDGMSTTVQGVGAHRIRFTSTDPALPSLVDAIIGLASSGAPTAEFTMVAESDGSIRLVTDTEWLFTDRAQLEGQLVTVVNDFVARTLTDAVLHAATLRSPTGDTVIFPADPGSGKSTLAGLLVRRGWAYGGDESATIRCEDTMVLPCAKPIDLDAASCVVLGLGAEIAGDVAVRRINPEAVILDEPLDPPAAIVSPCYVGSDGEPAVQRLETTDALVQLVGSTLNLRYVGTPGLETLVRLAEGVPVHRIAYRSSAEACEQLAALGFDS
ncbi:MAG: hypothetical protein JST73_09630 [Actinobacteria bacterium]|nr:hypothetical protein [Actinomycetota bacterium]